MVSNIILSFKKLDEKAVKIAKFILKRSGIQGFDSVEKNSCCFVVVNYNAMISHQMKTFESHLTATYHKQHLILFQVIEFQVFGFMGGVITCIFQAKLITMVTKLTMGQLLPLTNGIILKLNRKRYIYYSILSVSVTIIDLGYVFLVSLIFFTKFNNFVQNKLDPRLKMVNKT